MTKLLGLLRALLPLWVGAGVYLFMLATGNDLLRDSDTFWQIAVGQWIIDHHAVPTTDVYSFTMKGAPWTSSSWFAQVLYAAIFSKWGWAGLVVLSSLAIGAAFAMFVRFITKYIDAPLTILLSMIVLWLMLPHMLARPHVLVMPVMVAWFGYLMAAADRQTAPSFWLLPLIALWANLHGSFVLGVALTAAVALIAVWEARAPDRVRLVWRWSVFSLGALVAICCTPYGWGSLLAARNIVNLGEVLTLLSEWQPMNFSRFGIFEACLLGLLLVILYRGVVLSLPRVFLALGLLHLALMNVRSVETFAFLAPLVVAKPFAQQLLLSRPIPIVPSVRKLGLAVFALAALVAATFGIVSSRNYEVIPTQVPAEALAALKGHKAERILNGYEFGGYMIAAGAAPFIDGRAELYGEKFVVDHSKAVSLKDVDTLIRLLSDYKIDAILINPREPLAQLLGRLPEWQNVYEDKIALAFVRAPRADTTEPAVK